MESTTKVSNVLIAILCGVAALFVISLLVWYVFPIIALAGILIVPMWYFGTKQYKNPDFNSVRDADKS